MRELYACQLDLRETPGATPVRDLVQEWVSRGREIAAEDIRALASSPVVRRNHHELSVALEPDVRSDDREWTLSWRRPDEGDAALLWRILIAYGPSPTNHDWTRFALRIRLERGGDRFQLAPLAHSFNAPVVVRTLLREHQAFDAGERLRPTYAERPAPDVSAFVALFEDSDRQPSTRMARYL
jgi:hypothetical protein